MRRSGVALVTCCLAIALTVAAATTAPADSSQEQKTFDATYGEEAAKVAARTREAPAFADKLLSAAVEAGTDAPLQALLCQKAYEFGLKTPAGYNTAEQAMRLLAKAAPDRAEQCQEKILQLCLTRYKAPGTEDKITAGRKLITQLLAMADAEMDAGKPAPAAAKYEEAGKIAKAMKSADAPQIARKVLWATGQKAADETAASLAKALGDDPKAANVARNLLKLHLVERDDPASAAKLLDQIGSDQELTAYLPLAVKTWMEVAPAQCLELGRWYDHLAVEAKALGRPRMLQRAKAYFEAYLTLQGKPGPKKEDLDADKEAKAAAKRLGDQLAKLGGAPPGGFQGPPEGLTAALVAWFKERDALTKPEEQKDAVLKKLSEVNGGKEIKLNGWNVEKGQIVELDFRDSPDLRSIGPIYGMKLRKLIIQGAGITSLSVLRGMKLEFLDVWKCRNLTSLEGLEGMPLKQLGVGETAVTGVKALSGTKLVHLSLGNCLKVTSLEGVEGLPLVDVDLYWCRALRSLEPLRGAPITRLNLGGCELVDSFSALGGMRMRDLAIDHNERVKDLRFVAGMPLTKLLVAYCPLRDISALADLPLIELSLDGTPVSDLRPLAKLKDLSRLSLLGCTKLARDSLPPLWGLPLVMVNLKGTPLSKPDVAAELRKRIPNVTVLIDEKTP